MTFPIPPAAMAGHIAVVGMTGSGKSSTSRVIVEHGYKAGERICILDTVKSDWHGILSNRDGTGPGLPFQILGGPHGHVPLHPSACVAIAELVARGKLPHTVIDMADFEMGGMHQFFNDFAPALMRNMRGVLRLVIEEAHELAPKEKSGMAGENIGVYHTKKLATAGRSKGLRLLVATQRVQALHNAVFGSCSTVIVHRMNLPADQEPVVKWLKGSVKEKATATIIERSMPELADGEAWVCSGVNKILERRLMPRMWTFDSGATPTDDEHRGDVVTAAVDVQQLRALVGTAVAEAKANDPDVLKAQIAELKEQLRGAASDDTKSYSARNEGFQEGKAVGDSEGYARATDEFREQIAGVLLAVAQTASTIAGEMERLEAGIEKETSRAQTPVTGNLHQRLPKEPAAGGDRGRTAPAPTRVAASPEPRGAQGAAGSSSIGNSGKRRILVALAQKGGGAGLAVRKLSLLTGISQKGGTWRTYMADLRGRGWIDGRDTIRITAAGVQALGRYEPLPTGPALIDYWRDRLGNSGKRAIFDVLVAAYPRQVPGRTVAERTSIAIDGGTWRTYLAQLRGLELVEGRSELRAAAELFE
jgi:hypothetical protein